MHRGVELRRGGEEFRRGKSDESYLSRGYESRSGETRNDSEYERSYAQRGSPNSLASSRAKADFNDGRRHAEYAGAIDSQLLADQLEDYLNFPPSAREIATVAEKLSRSPLRNGHVDATAFYAAANAIFSNRLDYFEESLRSAMLKKVDDGRSLRHEFQDMVKNDKSMTGRVGRKGLAKQVKNIVGNNGRVSNDEIDGLLWRCFESRDDFDLAAFADFVYRRPQREERDDPYEMPVVNDSGVPAEHRSALFHLAQAAVHGREARVVEATFAQFERSRAGRISEGDFRSALKLLGVTCPPELSRLVLDHYGQPESADIDYIVFLRHRAPRPSEKEAANAEAPQPALAPAAAHGPARAVVDVDSLEADVDGLDAAYRSRAHAT
ncbi:hypothetical protein M885DRAFT_507946 [Pelagophyceae sp. CCMP2097]|nr:hypothetical protein M885DRAFT_507946 [Pelagophyceae sp. CCMP2097]